MDRGSDFEDDPGTPPKKAKVQAPANKCFQNKWLEDPLFVGWLEPTNEGKLAKCIACGVTLQAGKSDLQKHAATAKHQKNVKAMKGSRSMHAFAKKPMYNSKHDEDVKKMEVHLSAYFAEHNVAYETADHLIKVLKKGAKDSKIVQDLTLGRYKCSSVVRGVLAKTESEELAALLRENDFSILIDESTDEISKKKNMCVLVRFVSYGKVHTRLLELIELDARDCSAQSLWDAFEKCMAKQDIPIGNIVGLACDNASVMVGKNDSFWTRLRARCPWAILLNCICHSAALVSKHATATLPSYVTGVLRNVSTYISESPKRDALMKDFQELYEEELNKILKPSGTRWLVMHPCIVRFLDHYDSLTGFFRCAVRDDPKDETAASILQNLSNPFLKAYLFFLEYVLNYLNEFNAFFQGKDTLIHKLSQSSTKLLRKFCQNYIVPGMLDNVNTINVAHPSNFVPLDNVYLGPECANYLKDMPLPVDKERKKTPAMLQDELNHMKKAFKLKCLDFYIKAASEMRNRLPVDKKLLLEMEFIDPETLLSLNIRADRDLQDLSALCANFKEKLELDENALALEWRTIPVELEKPTKERLAKVPPPEAWAEIQKMKDYSDKPMFPQLSRLAKCVMSLPHSNADTERAFCIVKDVKTAKRNRMGAENLNAIAVVRTAFADKNVQCYSLEVREEHLNKFNQDMYKCQE